MTGFLIFLAIAALFVTIGYFAWKAEQRRRAALHSFAVSKGWQYTPRDAIGLRGRWSGHPFGRGTGRRVSNVVRGVHEGRDFVSFDYQYTEQDTDSSGKSTSRTYHFHVTAVNLPCYFPTLHVSPESFFTRVGKALGLKDIDLESEDFNRKYRVQCPDEKFAHDVLHPRTMEFLLSCQSVPFRIEGGDLLCWDDGRITPADVLRHLYTTCGVVNAIPAFVWKDHGFDPVPNPNPGSVAS